LVSGSGWFDDVDVRSFREYSYSRVCTVSSQPAVLPSKEKRAMDYVAPDVRLAVAVDGERVYVIRVRVTVQPPAPRAEDDVRGANARDFQRAREGRAVGTLGVGARRRHARVVTLLRRDGSRRRGSVRAAAATLARSENAHIPAVIPRVRVQVIIRDALHLFLEHFPQLDRLIVRADQEPRRVRALTVEGPSFKATRVGVEVKGVRSGVERRRGRVLKASCGRRETPPGKKFLKDRRSPRGRGRMGTSVR